MLPFKRLFSIKIPDTIYELMIVVNAHGKVESKISASIKTWEDIEEISNYTMDILEKAIEGE